MKFFASICVVTLLQMITNVIGSACEISAPYSTINAENFTIAAVREPPANFALPVGLNKTWADLDLKATIFQATSIIDKAKKENVAFLAFPELYFPGYPVVSPPFMPW